MSDPTMNGVGELQGRLGRKRSLASVLAVTLGLTASLVASPTVKRDTSKATESSQSKEGAGKRHWYQQIGRATWYGGQFNGRHTASGERYDMNGLTCAHRTLPFGSWLRVTNLKTSKVLLVRVNDRGPVSKYFVLDLSYAAARRLGISSVSTVSVEEVKIGDPEVMQQLVAQLHMPNDPAVLKAPAMPSVGLLAAVDK